MNLTYNPASGLIKRGGAVVGIVTQTDAGFTFDHYKFKDAPQLTALSIKKLLSKIKVRLEEDA